MGSASFRWVHIKKSIITSLFQHVIVFFKIWHDNCFFYRNLQKYMNNNMNNKKEKFLQCILTFSAFMSLKGTVHASGSAVPLPEPGILLVLGLGLMGVAFYRRMKNK